MPDADPASDRQKKKLRHFGITVKKGLTEVEASRLLDAAEAADPAREEAYQIAKDREEDAWILGEIVNDEDRREMGEYKKLTGAQILKLRDYLKAHFADPARVDDAQTAAIIRHLFPDRIKTPVKPRQAQKAKGCLLLFTALAAVAALLYSILAFQTV